MSNGGRVHLVAFGEPGLSNDKDVCMEAVSERGEALIHCSAQMRVLDQGLQFHCQFGNYLEVQKSPKILVNHMMARLFHAERIKSHLMET